MNRPRKHIFTNYMYLNKINDGDIRNDSDTQRQFVWTNEQTNELIVTVLTDDYIPPIILAEVDNAQLWIVDGGQRSSSLNKFRYGNYKITSAIENSIIPYKAKSRDENGNIVWIDASFDIKNKTFDKLPEELQKKFNEYQIETVIHEDCDAHRIAQLIKRYNNHTSMNTNQKAFTYIDNFAREIREIIEGKFFLDCGCYTEKERVKGVLERVVLESVMCMSFIDDWKKKTKQMATFLNENATQNEFSKFKNNLKRLEKIVGSDLKDMFSSKDSFIWFATFDKFIEFGLDDTQFAEFLRAFKDGLRDEMLDGISYAELDENRGTKDKAVVVAKLNHLVSLMCKYFNISQDFFNNESLLTFVQENVDVNISNEDLELYTEIAGDLTEDKNKNIAAKNKQSVTAIIAYACVNDIDLDDYIGDILSATEFSDNQTENYIYMKERLGEFINVPAQ